MCAAGSGRSGRSPENSHTNQRPKVRWSTKASSRLTTPGPALPSPTSLVGTSSSARIRRCFDCTCPGLPTSICPLIPRCTYSAWPSASSAHRNFPRRHQRLITASCSSPANGNSCPRLALGCRTSTLPNRAPVVCSAKPERTTSTSGNSGTG